MAKLRGFLHRLVASVSEEHAGILKISKEQCLVFEALSNNDIGKE